MLLVFSVNTNGLLPLKHRKGITIINAFRKVLDESNSKPNKIWVNKGSDFTI